MSVQTEASLLADLDATTFEEEHLEQEGVFNERLSKEGQQVLHYAEGLDTAVEDAKVEPEKNIKRRLLKEVDVWRRLYINSCRTFARFEEEQIQSFNNTRHPGNKITESCNKRVPVEAENRKAYAEYMKGLAHAKKSHVGNHTNATDANADKDQEGGPPEAVDPEAEDAKNAKPEDDGVQQLDKALWSL